MESKKSEKKGKIPTEIIRELDIHETKKKPTSFEITPIVETHQIKLPIPRKLLKIYDLDFEKGKKLTLEFKQKEKELRYKF